MDLDEKKRTLFVGNAPLSMDERSCKKLFSQYGPVSVLVCALVISLMITVVHCRLSQFGCGT